MKIAAYQAPLLPIGSMDAIGSIRERVRECEAGDVSILCCSEAILGGLADYAENPLPCAIRADQLDYVLAPIASDTVTTIVGFTELSIRGRIYNAAAVFHRGSVRGIYRKLHPAINRSVYSAGKETPVFHVEGLTFGVVICNDSNFPEPAGRMAAQGATALFIPTNCGLPSSRFGPEIVAAARKVDLALATKTRMWVIRADVAGRIDAGSHGELVSYGSSAIVEPEGIVVQTAQLLHEDLIVMEIPA